MKGDEQIIEKLGNTSNSKWHKNNGVELGINFKIKFFFPSNTWKPISWSE